MNLIEENYFCTPIYIFEKKEWVVSLNRASDLPIKNAFDINKVNFKNNKDFGLVHHSDNLFFNEDFKEFNTFICKKAFDILDKQGFDMNLYSLILTECWVQEFSKEGGGNHSLHNHYNGHISGFYFLKCSEKTSLPIFHDPRPSKKMIQLKQKNEENITHSSDKIHFKIKPGLFIFFNSYLEHEYVLDYGIEPFRFIHFNIQAIPKEIINNNLIKL